MKRLSMAADPVGRGQKGAALVIVLCMVVLLSTLILAFFSKTVSEHQISSSSSNQVKVDLFSQGAVDQIIGDLRQEIASGSVSPAEEITTGSVKTTIYRPSTSSQAAPQLVLPNYPASNPSALLNTGLENLVKISKKNGVTLPTGVQARAVDSLTTDPSQNSRVVSRERWNKALLLKKKDAATTAITPVDAFIAPDWILVSRDGSNPTGAWNNNLRAGTNRESVVGRYAYAIYNEGGLLDANVAGYSTAVEGNISNGTTSLVNGNQQKYKTALSHADLTQVGLTQTQIDDLVSWRNQATLATAPALNYFNLPLLNPGFMSTFNKTFPSDQTDRLFVSRQQLIDFFMKKLGNGAGTSVNAALQDSLQYFGTFSRSLNQPSYFPDPGRPKVWALPWSATSTGSINDAGNSGYGKDDEFNPPFRRIRAKSAFARADGSKAVIGEPLVKKRFPLNRIAWLTHRGPSADNMNDPIVQEMIRLLGGDPSDNNDPVRQFVAQGTATRIFDSFGLAWTTTGGKSYWLYKHPVTGSIATLRQVADDSPAREADFFELLKASIHAGSLATGNDGIGTNNGNGIVRLTIHQEATQVDNQIIQIGANIIDQFWPENFPTWIVFDDGFGPGSFWGTVDLPYFYGDFTLGLLNRQATPPAPADGADVSTTGIVAPSDPGKVTALDVPILWNPHATGRALANNASPTELRICISNFNDSRGNLYQTSPTSFSYNFYPKNWDSTKTYVLPADNLPDGVGGNDNMRYWNKGTWDPNTGTIVMLAAGTPNNTALYFQNGTNTLPLYREPTPLMRNVGGIGLTIDAQNLIVTKGSYTTSGVNEEGGSDYFLGFYIATCPQRWLDNKNVGAPPVSTPTVFTIGRIEGQEYGCTVSLEYKSGNDWIPYHQFIRRDGSNVDGAPVAFNFTGTGSVFNKRTLDYWRIPSNTGPQGVKRSGMVKYDPRGRRWIGTAEVPIGDFIDGAKSKIKTFKPDVATQDNSRSIQLGGTSKDMNIGTGYMLSPDTTTSASATGRFARRAAGAYATTTVGMPIATVEGNSSNQYNRPIILHRPFRTVAELGYVYSDTGWRNLDFFTPESGDAALLDVFTISDDTRNDSVVAGKVDLNGRQRAVFQAIISGSYRDENTGNSVLNSSNGLTEAKSLAPGTESGKVAKALVDRTNAVATPGKGPLTNIADLVGRFRSGSTNGAPRPAPYEGFSADINNLLDGGSANNVIQRFREGPIRSLSNVGQAGTWNLMIDVVSQTGRYPTNATGYGNFVVEGERRYWIHLAIDRQTAQVVDQQVEVVSE